MDDFSHEFLWTSAANKLHDEPVWVQRTRDALQAHGAAQTIHREHAGNPVGASAGNILVHGIRHHAFQGDTTVVHINLNRSTASVFASLLWPSRSSADSCAETRFPQPTTAWYKWAPTSDCIQANTRDARKQLTLWKLIATCGPKVTWLRTQINVPGGPKLTYDYSACGIIHVHSGALWQQSFQRMETAPSSQIVSGISL